MLEIQLDIWNTNNSFQFLYMVPVTYIIISETLIIWHTYFRSSDSEKWYLGWLNVKRCIYDYKLVQILVQISPGVCLGWKGIGGYDWEGWLRCLFGREWRAKRRSAYGPHPLCGLSVEQGLPSASFPPPQLKNASSLGTSQSGVWTPWPLASPHLCCTCHIPARCNIKIMAWSDDFLL